MAIQRPVVTVTRRLPETVERRLASRFDVRLNPSDVPLDVARMLDALRVSDAVLSTLGDPLSGDVLRTGARRARLLAQFGVGYDNIDIGAAREIGITVTNTPGVLTDDTADLTILLLLMVARRAGEGEREIRSGEWRGWRPTHMLGTRLTGKTLGIVGFGRIGQAVARRASAGFGMRVLAWSRSLTEEAAAAAGVERCESLESLLPACDFVTIHVPSSAGTRRLLDAQRLALLPPHAVFVNTARGDVVDEAALISALRHRTIAGAGLDVFEGEPRVSRELLSLPNVTALPHIGSATIETRTAMGMRAVENIDAFFDGRSVIDPVT